MPTPKPLHVLAAEAIGWTAAEPGAPGQWLGRNPRGGSKELIGRYDEDHAKAGAVMAWLKPLLYWEERHQGWVAAWPVEREEGRVYGTGLTWPAAVAKLVVELAAAGRLPSPPDL